MSTKFVAGDFPQGTTAAETFGDILLMMPSLKPGQLDLSPPSLRLGTYVTEVERVTEENKANVLGKVGWGAAGLVALGPLGAVAGLILGGNSKELCAVCTLSDGRKAMVVCSPDAYQKLVAAALKNKATPAAIPAYPIQSNQKANAGCIVALVIGCVIFFLIVYALGRGVGKIFGD